MKKRQSIDPTYDSTKDGFQYMVSTSVNHRSIGSKDIADPFVTHTVRVSLLDTIKGLFRGGVTVVVSVNPKNNRITEDVLELDAEYLSPGSTRQEDFHKGVMDRVIKAMDRLEDI